LIYLFEGGVYSSYTRRAGATEAGASDLLDMEVEELYKLRSLGKDYNFEFMSKAIHQNESKESE